MMKLAKICRSTTRFFALYYPRYFYPRRGRGGFSGGGGGFDGGGAGVR